jgi:hypothetical protein
MSKLYDAACKYSMKYLYSIMNYIIGVSAPDGAKHPFLRRR